MAMGDHLHASAGTDPRPAAARLNHDTRTGAATVDHRALTTERPERQPRRAPAPATATPHRPHPRRIATPATPAAATTRAATDPTPLRSSAASWPRMTASRASRGSRWCACGHRGSGVLRSRGEAHAGTWEGGCGRHYSSFMRLGLKLLGGVRATIDGVPVDVGACGHAAV